MTSFFLPQVTATDQRPVYGQGSAKVTRESVMRWTLGELIDIVATVLANVAAIWLTVVVLIHGLEHWHTLGYLVVFWALLTYLVLPRWHQSLTTLYVPDYYIGRTRTQDGLLGDPINLAVIGSEAEIHRAMTAAGWTLADPITLKSSWRIVVSSLRRQSYPQAPVSDLFLFKKSQSFAYQQEVEGNPAQRHHVRFWRCPEGWLLPGGRRVDWLAGGTYDRSVGLSLFTLQVTHKIDQNVDIERDFIVDSVRFANPEVQVEVLPDFSTSYHHRNGGGDLIQTDGALPVLHVGGELEPEVPDPAPKVPFMLWLATVLVTLAAVGTGVLLIISAAMTLVSGGFSWTEVLAMLGAFALTGVGVFLLWGVFAGYQRARITVLVVELLNLYMTLLAFSNGETAINWMQVSMALLSLLAVVSLSSDSVRHYVDYRSAARHAKSRPDAVQTVSG